MDMIDPTDKRKREIVNFFLEKKILVGKDLADNLDTGFNESDFYSFLKSKIEDSGFMFLNNDLVGALNEKERLEVNWPEMERFKSMQERGLSNLYTDFIKLIKSQEAHVAGEQCRKEDKGSESIKIMASFDEPSQKINVQDFVLYYNVRYNSIKKFLENRQELQDTTSINRIAGKKERGPAATVGIVAGKRETQNNNVLLTLEDPTGSINVLVNKNRQDLYETAKEIVLDETIGVVGVSGEKIIFANNILLPEIPVHKEMKKAGEEGYAVFLSDLHVGSNNFLPAELNKFLQWISGNTGSKDQRDMAQKVKYIFIVGDLVDGVGVYPGQEEELDIKDVKEQYLECARLLKQIPPGIKIIVCPGNHDATRISEPQPPLTEDFAKPILDMPNVISVSNPALINIHSSEDFPGFDVLVYHGYSFDYFVANVDAIREKGGYDRPDLIMKFLLQRRHLAPTHTSTLYVPDSNKDPLVIDKIPDFFITGHIHKAAAANYRNVTMICGSCWQSKTSFQEKVGHNPEPARVPVVDLKTRKVKMLRF